jgi:thiol-disulfide isomerase/thioredoxin
LVLDSTDRTTLISRDEFIAKWTGVTLLVEKGENSAEPGYQDRRREVLFYRSLLFLLGLVGLVWLIVNLVNHAGILPSSIGTWSLMALKIAGLAIATILLWTEIDKDNSAITKFCTGGKSVDCNSVLDSFSFGGIISLSNLAFAYFFSSVGLLMISSFSGSSLQLLSYLSYSSLLIVPISLFYQGVKIKKWCMLCLWISGILLLEFVASQFLLVDLVPPGLKELSIFSFLFLASVLVWLTLKPYLIAKGELQGVKSKLAKFMANREVFDYFLSSSRKILTKPAGLGIFLKGQSSKFHVLKVCNPYCGPCARTHPFLEKLYEAGNIDLQILFLPGGEGDTRIQTVSHLLAIAAKGNKDQTRKALDDWYLPEKKDYNVFATRYPMNGELAKQESMIKAMENWAEREQITHTPTIFINGYELPSSYEVEDLKYVLQ